MNDKRHVSTPENGNDTKLTTYARILTIAFAIATVLMLLVGLVFKDSFWQSPQLAKATERVDLIVPPECAIKSTKFVSELSDPLNETPGDEPLNRVVITCPDSDTAPPFETIVDSLKAKMDEVGYVVAPGDNKRTYMDETLVVLARDSSREIYVDVKA